MKDRSVEDLLDLAGRVLVGGTLGWVAGGGVGEWEDGDSDGLENDSDGCPWLGRGFRRRRRAGGGADAPRRGFHHRLPVAFRPIRDERHPAAAD